MVDDLDEDFYDELDDVQVNQALGCTFSMDRDYVRVGIIQEVNLIQTLVRESRRDKREKM
jgi:hypothetical protein